ncbi:protoporphyrinogen oxidase [bacterium]|nr:protoporphyrinogen oxidase [bacterium]
MACGPRRAGTAWVSAARAGPDRSDPVHAAPFTARAAAAARRTVGAAAATAGRRVARVVRRAAARSRGVRAARPAAGCRIWTADPARLSMAAACGEFLAMEREQGSLWAGERRRIRATAAQAASGARYGQFLTLATGLQTLPERLAARLRDRGVRFIDAEATGIERPAGGGWRLSIAPPPGAAATIAADAVVLAVPAPVAGRLLAAAAPVVATDLQGITYAGSAVISLGFARADVAHPLDAAGLVIPRRAGRRILAVSFSSSKFPGRAPEGCVLLRVFAGGALDPDVVRGDDAALESVARAEVAELLGARGTPRLVQIDRWHAAMPQYHVGHVERVARIMEGAATIGGLALAGAAYTGVGIPQVIASGQAAARHAWAG